MTDKITLATVGNLQDTTTAAATINSNFSIIQAATDNTLSRDGTAPNQMASSIDMNSHRILNLPAPASSAEPARLVDIGDAIAASAAADASAIAAAASAADADTKAGIALGAANAAVTDAAAASTSEFNANASAVNSAASEQNAATSAFNAETSATASAASATSAAASAASVGPISNAVPLIDGVADAGTSINASRGDHVHPVNSSLLTPVNIDTVRAFDKSTVYTRVFGGDGTAAALVAGSSTDPTNYYLNAQHTFAASTATVGSPFATMSSGGTAIHTPVTVPTPTAGDSSTNAATTAFVATSFAPKASPTFTGTPVAPTASALTDNTQIATTAYADTAVAVLSATTNTALGLKAPLASPALTGTPTAPTATVGTNTTQLATTEFVLANGGSGSSVSPATVAPLVDGTAAVGTSLLYARQDHVHPTDTSRAALASPTFTGVPAAPTATVGTNTTQLATTAFVIANAGGGGGGGRTILTANQTFFVLPTGSDSNDGMTNTSGGAFLTVQHALTVTAALDIRSFNVTIQLGDGTYTTSNVVGSAWLGSGTVIVKGNTTTPANVIINPTFGDCFTVTGATLSVIGMTLTTGSGSGINALLGSKISTGTAIVFGACSTSHIASAGGTIALGASYTISGGAQTHISINTRGVLTSAGLTVTLVGTPAFSGNYIRIADPGSSLTYSFFTFSGTATGSRYSVTNGAVLNTSSGSITYLPGSTAGSGTNFSVSPWGLYL